MDAKDQSTSRPTWAAIMDHAFAAPRHAVHSKSYNPGGFDASSMKHQRDLKMEAKAQSVATPSPTVGSNVMREQSRETVSRPPTSLCGGSAYA